MGFERAKALMVTPVQRTWKKRGCGVALALMGALAVAFHLVAPRICHNMLLGVFRSPEPPALDGVSALLLALPETPGSYVLLEDQGEIASFAELAFGGPAWAHREPSLAVLYGGFEEAWGIDRAGAIACELRYVPPPLEVTWRARVMRRLLALPPSSFIEAEATCPECSGPVEFVFTLGEGWDDWLSRILESHPRLRGISLVVDGELTREELLARLSAAGMQSRGISFESGPLSGWLCGFIVTVTVSAGTESAAACQTAQRLAACRAEEAVALLRGEGAAFSGHSIGWSKPKFSVSDGSTTCTIAVRAALMSSDHDVMEPAPGEGVPGFRPTLRKETFRSVLVLLDSSPDEATLARALHGVLPDTWGRP